jgi:hypothetical protein
MPTASAEVVEPATPALPALAEQMIEFTGDPLQAERIAFTFTASFQSLRVLERSYVWHPQEGRLRVFRSQHFIEFVGIDRVDPSSAVRHPRRHADVWRSVAPDTGPRRAARAWSAFINDRWWFMAPAFIVAPDSEITVEDNRVRVFFPTGGVTPGDTFEFTVDPLTGEVASWTYDLHGGLHGDFVWAPAEDFGPMLLSTVRTTRNEQITIGFESIEVL